MATSVLWAESGLSMNSYAGAAPIYMGGNDDFDWTWVEVGQPPQRRTAPKAKQCLWSAAEDGCHPSTQTTNLWPANGINTAPKPMQLPAVDTVLNCFARKPKFQQLHARNDAMLSFRQRPDLATGWMKSFTHQST